MSNPQRLFVPKPGRCRNVVFLFDGTGDKENDHMTHVCRLKEMFPNDDPGQLVYYQEGIGTSNPYDKDLNVPILSPISRLTDEAVAWSLDVHLKDAYVFLMENYGNGDKFFIFGFSRGAYIARAFAGMVNALGLLPNKDPEPETESVESLEERVLTFGFAGHKPPKTKFELIVDGYNLYSRELERVEDAAGLKKHKQELALKKEDLEDFKRKYSSTDIFIDFIGCWDTVNSVGIIRAIRLPSTARNDIVRVFRHALALDEHRVRFRPSLWTQNKDGAPDSSKKPRVITDAKEVWFSGAHDDVGGGSVENNVRHSLALITLRWMIRECFMAETGVMFDVEHMRRYGLDLDPITLHPRSRSAEELIASPGDTIQADDANPLYQRAEAAVISHTPSAPEQGPIDPLPPYPTVGEAELDAQDALTALHDNLIRKPLLWEPLEYAFLRTDVFQPNAKEGEPRFIEKLQQNLGAGRTLLVPKGPNGRSGKVFVYRSVYLRLKAQSANGNDPYIPLAMMVDESLPEDHVDFGKRLKFDEKYVEWVI